MSKEERRELRTSLSKAGRNLVLAGLIWMVATFIFGPIVATLALGRPTGIGLSIAMLVAISFFYVRFLLEVPELARSSTDSLYPEPNDRDEDKVRALRHTLYIAVTFLTLLIYSSILAPIHSSLYGVLLVGAILVILYSLVVIVGAYSSELVEWLRKIARKTPS